MPLDSATSPSVAVLLPFRNAVATIEQAVRSVLDDDSASVRLYAIDDGSQDGSAELVTSLARRDARIRLIRSSGRGLVAALQTGFGACSEPFVARMDADDISLPHRFGEQLAYLRSQGDVAAVGSRVRAFPPQALGPGMQRFLQWQNSLLTPEDHARELFVESPLCHPSVMLRRDALEAVGGWRDVPWAEDYDLWLRLDLAGWKLAKLPRVYLAWRQHAGQLTRTDDRLSLEKFMQAKAEFLRHKIEDQAFALWGAGPTGKRLARALRVHGLHPERFVDIDPRKIGRRVQGIEVVDVDWLRTYPNVTIVAVGARGARDLIRKAMRAMGKIEGQDYLFAS